MSWNYRIFKEIEYTGVIDESNWAKEIEEEVYTIREVHYDEQHKPTSYTGGGYWPIGSTKNELLRNILDMQDAFTKPILTIEDFK